MRSFKNWIVAAIVAVATVLTLSAASPASAAGPSLPAGSYNTSMSIMLTGNKIVYRGCLSVDNNLTATPCKSPNTIGRFAVRHHKLIFVANKGSKIVSGGFSYCTSNSCVDFPTWKVKTPLPVTQKFGGIRYHLSSAHVELMR